MKIVFVSGFFSEGMGYAENCLPKAMASLGHEVTVLTSNLNVYGNEPGYSESYESFLGPADQGVRVFESDGFTVHRLPSRILFGYIYIKGLYKALRKLNPDIVHSFEIASLITYKLALIKPFFRFRLFTESHQHMSVTKPYLRGEQRAPLRVLNFRLTRTLPTFISSLNVVRCYAISPDCAEVAVRFYGVPQGKVKIQSLGTDTDLFRIYDNKQDIDRVKELRIKLGLNPDEIVCIYTGRFSDDKNPLLLAEAIRALSSQGLKYRGLFIGGGKQAKEIEAIQNNRIIKFVRYRELADYYSASDIGVWPMQESTSMLDAASCGLPLVVSDTMGDRDRITGNGTWYKEGDAESLAEAIKSLGDRNHLRELGRRGREKMVEKYSWRMIASKLARDFGTK